MALRRLHNWHSLQLLIEALQSPELYALDACWAHVQHHHATHFNAYLTLCHLVGQFNVCLVRSVRGQSCIPTLRSLVTMFKLHCGARWDLIVNARKWTEPPNLSKWLEREARSNAGHLPATPRLVKPVVASPAASDQLRLIPISSLPVSWTQVDVSRVPSSLRDQLVHCYLQSFGEEMAMVRKHSCFTGNLEVNSSTS